MTLHLYDFDGINLGFTDKIISSYRDTRWNDIGTSEFHIENTDPLVNLIISGKYLFLEDENGFQDIIIGYECGEDFAVYCRSLSWLLSKMIIPPTTYSGTVSSCVSKLLSVSYGCDISLGVLPSISSTYKITTDKVTLFSDTLKTCLDTVFAGHLVRFSHSDKKFYLDITLGKDLDFYVSEDDGTLDSITLSSDSLDLSTCFVFKKRMKYMGQWNPSSNSPSLTNNSSDNYALYYQVNLNSDSYTRFDISWSDGNYIYCNTSSGKWKKSSTPPDDFYVYVLNSSVDDKYKWYYISNKENKEDASLELKQHKINKSFSAKSRNLTFLKDYNLGDFVKLQYSSNNKTITIPCQFVSVVINQDNLDNTENPTLKEVK